MSSEGATRSCPSTSDWNRAFLGPSWRCEQEPHLVKKNVGDVPNRSYNEGLDIFLKEIRVILPFGAPPAPLWPAVISKNLYRTAGLGKVGHAAVGVGLNSFNRDDAGSITPRGMDKIFPSLHFLFYSIDSVPGDVHGACDFAFGCARLGAAWQSRSSPSFTLWRNELEPCFHFQIKCRTIYLYLFSHKLNCASKPLSTEYNITAQIILQHTVCLLKIP